jgi:hypothetical protein
MAMAAIIGDAPDGWQPVNEIGTHGQPGLRNDGHGTISCRMTRVGHHSQRPSLSAFFRSSEDAVSETK